MAARLYYSWKQGDVLWKVAGTFLPSSSYTSTIQLAGAIRQQNPQVLDWTTVPVGTRIVLPLISLG